MSLLTEYETIQCYLAAEMPGESKQAQAEALGVTRATLYNWRDDKYQPDINWLKSNAARADWVGELCRALLKGRGLAVVEKEPSA